MWRWPLDVAALGTRPQPLLLAGLALPRLERFKRLVQGSYPLVQVISVGSCVCACVYVCTCMCLCVYVCILFVYVHEFEQL